MDRLGTTTAANRGSTNHNQQANFNMVSGIGQYHTNEPGKSNPTPYLSIDLDGIRALVDNPQQVDKSQAQWLIPSPHPSRNFKEQEQHGQYPMLWADLDTNPPDQAMLAPIIEGLILGADYEIYSSRSATAANMKCRVLIPLTGALDYSRWAIAQSVFNDLLETCVIKCDRANERAAQLCYLPNRGEFYQSTSRRNGQFFDLRAWDGSIDSKIKTINDERLAAEAKKQASEARRATLDLSGTPGVVAAFNQAYTVEEWLLKAGYDQQGNSFRYPESESGSYSATVLDGRVNALSPNDPLYTGSGAHDAFSVFTVLFHGGDTSAAMKDAGDNWLAIGGVSYNKAKQIDWAKNNANHFLAAKPHNAMANMTPATFNGRTNLPVNPGAIDARDGTQDTRPLTEIGNAQRLLDEHGDNIRYVHDAKAWLHWRDSAWHWDADGAITRQLAVALPNQIYNEGVYHIAEGNLFAKHARASAQKTTINAAVSLLSDFEHVRLSVSAVDADVFKVGLDNAKQVLDLRTGEICPARQDDYITKSLRVVGLGEPLKAIRWREFLNQIFNADAELIKWVQRWCGYLLTGDTSEHFLIFCFGSGANGKSVFADTLRFIMGDYARVIATETLTESKRSAGGATPDLAELIGARMALSSETEDGAALAESLIKNMVSGDTMTARNLYSAPMQFKPQFKLMMLGNHKPMVRGGDYGIWRRIRLVPFTRTFKASKRDRRLSEKLQEEAPHILAWMLEGCIEWQKRGLSDTPETVKQATGDYKEEQDIIGCWLDECCLQSRTAEASASDLYLNYKLWAERNGLRPYSNTALGRKLSERGFVKRKSHGVIRWEGVAPDPARGIFSHCAVAS